MSGEQVNEFKAMVRELHRAGIEVILDVVYNHTAEGNRLGPTLSFRGIANSTYYRLVESDPRHYFDTTGTGNSFNVREPHALQLIMDSLRYWVTEMHVDGFRFDLASSLAREHGSVDRLSTFFDLVQQDPVVSQVKLIAEPWDLGEGGYQVGNFPVLWTEWNGKYRDTARDYWRGQPASLPEIASRFTGSSDLYRDDGRSPHASINFVTAHDGFSMRDLVSYNDKHNEAIGEGNRDGESFNRSWNCGVEGPTDNPDVLALRARQQRNLMATLLLSQGVPMILHGDEVSRTQLGNNNAYCQDNDLAWIDWANLDHHMLAFTRMLTGLRRAHPIFRRQRFFQGRKIVSWAKVPDISWLKPSGEPMTDENWRVGYAKTLTVVLNGDALDERDRFGMPVRDSSFAVFFNASELPAQCMVPGRTEATRWRLVFDTADWPQSASPDRRGCRGDVDRARSLDRAVAGGRLRLSGERGLARSPRASVQFARKDPTARPVTLAAAWPTAPHTRSGPCSAATAMSRSSGQDTGTEWTTSAQSVKRSLSVAGVG